MRMNAKLNYAIISTCYVAKKASRKKRGRSSLYEYFRNVFRPVSASDPGKRALLAKGGYSEMVRVIRSAHSAGRLLPSSPLRPEGSSGEEAQRSRCKNLC